MTSDGFRAPLDTTLPPVPPPAHVTEALKDAATAQAHARGVAEGAVLAKMREVKALLDEIVKCGGPTILAKTGAGSHPTTLTYRRKGSRARNPNLG